MKDDQNVPRKFPLIRQNQNSNNNYGQCRVDNFKSNDTLNSHSKGKSLNYFNKTATVFLGRGNKFFSSTNGKDIGAVKRVRLGDLNKIKLKNNEEKNTKNGIEGGEDSFINELEDLLINVNNHKDLNEINEDDAKSADDEQPDPRINFEHINELNKARPQTSYGGLNQRRKKLQIALKSAKYRTKNKPEEEN